MISNPALYQELIKIPTGSDRDIVMLPVVVSKLFGKYGINQEGFVTKKLELTKLGIKIIPLDNKIKQIVVEKGITISNNSDIHKIEQYECPKCGKDTYRNWTTLLEYELGRLKHHKCNSCDYDEIIPILNKTADTATYEVLRVDVDGTVIYC